MPAPAENRSVILWCFSGRLRPETSLRMTERLVAEAGIPASAKNRSVFLWFFPGRLRPETTPMITERLVALAGIHFGFPPPRPPSGPSKIYRNRHVAIPYDNRELLGSQFCW